MNSASIANPEIWKPVITAASADAVSIAAGSPVKILESASPARCEIAASVAFRPVLMTVSGLGVAVATARTFSVAMNVAGSFAAPTVTGAPVMATLMGVVTVMECVTKMVFAWTSP